MSIMQKPLSYILVLVSISILFDKSQGGYYWKKHKKSYSYSVTSCDPGFVCKPKHDCWYGDVQWKESEEVKCGFTYSWKKKVCCRESIYIHPSILITSSPASPVRPFPGQSTQTYTWPPIPSPPAPPVQPFPRPSTRTYPRSPSIRPYTWPPIPNPPVPPVQPFPRPSTRTYPRPPIQIPSQPTIKVPPPAFRIPPRLPTVPPPPIETEPSIPFETEPPTPIETEPPTPIETEPPTPIETELPVPLETEPPMPFETEPPAPIKTEPPVPNPTEPSMPNECFTTNLPIPDCGQAIPEAGEHGAWPWMVSIMKTGEDGEPYHFCSGFLIDSIHVISGATCFLDGELQNFTARVGHVDAKQGDLYAINKITVHEGYTDGLFYDDIALVTLSREVDVPKFNPICLPTPLQNKNLTGLSVTSLGYSEINTEGEWIGVPLLQMTKTSVISNFKCNEDYKMFTKTFPVGITEKSTCTEGGIPVCKGAGGGPLMYKNNFRWYAVGLLSFTCACGTCEFPEGYTNIHKYLSWIREKAD